MSMKHVFSAAAIAAALFGSTASAETVDINLLDMGNNSYWTNFSGELIDAGFYFYGDFTSSSSPSDPRFYNGFTVAHSDWDSDWDGVFDLQNTVVHYLNGTDASLAQIAGDLNNTGNVGNVTVSSNFLSAYWYSDSPVTSLTFAYNTIPGVPEPETWAMLLAGLGVIGGVARRRRA